MLLATWNVNSVRARLPRLVPWLAARRPDVVLLQETKCADELFPREPFEDLGYRIETFGQPTYNGVALLSLLPLEDVVRGLPGDGADAERRVLGATAGAFTVLDVYVVNGQDVGTPAYAKKLEWLARLADFVEERYSMDQRVVVAGDFNVTVDDRDVPEPEAYRERILCSTPERAALRRLMAAGLVDGLRWFDQEPGVYTWWDFRTRGFERGLGLRIDHVLLSPPAIDACRGVEVDLEARAGEKPSDHAPLLARFAD